MTFIRAVVSTMGRLTRDYMNGLKTLRKIDVDYKKPDSMAKLEKVTDKDVQTWLDSLDSHLLVVFGATKASLAYVTCEEGAMPPGLDPSGDYANIQEGMIRRAPHGTPEYSTDSVGHFEAGCAWNAGLHLD
jgi:hypothetical protein